jgi:hypothetical protein
VLGGKTLYEVRKRKMMRRSKIVIKELGVFTLTKHALFKYTLMGFHEDKVQSTSTGFYILPRANDKEATAYQKQRYV